MSETEVMETVNVKASPRDLADLRHLAQLNERTLAAEIRIAIRKHLKEESKP